MQSAASSTTIGPGHVAEEAAPKHTSLYDGNAFNILYI
jgi:hypothetical protein